MDEGAEQGSSPSWGALLALHGCAGCECSHQRVPQAGTVTLQSTSGSGVQHKPLTPATPQLLLENCENYFARLTLL